MPVDFKVIEAERTINEAVKPHLDMPITHEDKQVIQADDQLQKLIKSLKKVREKAIIELTSKIEGMNGQQLAMTIGIITDKIEMLDSKPSNVIEIENVTLDGEQITREELATALHEGISIEALKKRQKRQRTNALVTSTPVPTTF